jgi:putative flippase GtrA
MHQRRPLQIVPAHPPAPRLDRRRHARDAPPQVEVVVPVYNEQAALEPSIRRLHRYLADEFPFTWAITVADNASTDATPEIGAHLQRTLPGVSYLRLERKGRGLALRQAWSSSGAKVVAYMDVDLSTDLHGLLPLVAPLISGHSDVAIGSRLARGARVTRGLKREFISRSYNLILRSALRARFTDAQCGFKAVRAAALRDLLDDVRDDGWFFDTELLVLAQRRGMRIHEVPVDWVDDPDSRVAIVRTAVDDLKGVARLAWASHLTRFLAVGVASTLAHALLFLALRGALGPGAANALALALTAVANTAANRRLTFGVRGRDEIVRHHLKGLTVFALGLALTTGALGLLHAIDPAPARAVELTVLVGANLCATVLRYLAMRTWVFARGRREAAAATEPALVPSEQRAA